MITYYDLFDKAKAAIEDKKNQVFIKLPNVNSIGIAKDSNSFYLEASLDYMSFTIFRNDPKDPMLEGIKLVSSTLLQVDLKKTNTELPLHNIEANFPIIRPGLTINEGGIISAIVYKPNNTYPYLLSCEHVVKPKVLTEVTHGEVGIAHAEANPQQITNLNKSPNKQIIKHTIPLP